MELSKYKLKWTLAVFNTEWCNPKEWAKFRKKHDKKWMLNNIHNHNKMCIWYLQKERINWIKENVPAHCKVHFIQITDKQFGESEVFYKGDK